MKKIPIMLISMLFIILTANGQNLFFIGENSYPCSEPFALKSNLDDGEDLNILFAKDGATAVIAVTTKSSLQGTIISGKLIVYLDDGTVISCNDKGESHYIDDTAKAVYFLPNEQVNKMKKSNINTISYTLKIYGIKEVNRSASNNGFLTKDLAAKFFNNVDPVNEGTVKKEQELNKKKLNDLLNGDSYAISYYGAPGSGSGTGGYGLKGRTLAGSSSVKQDCNEEGRVVVQIVVDRNGKVISATPGVKGTTNTNQCLMKPAELTARSHTWKPDLNAPSQQVGFVVVNFKL